MLWLNGDDLRSLPLIERKRHLHELVCGSRCHAIIYALHIEDQGIGLFEEICALGLEGIVAKRTDSLYRATEKPSPHWVKIKNRNYTQSEGREEFFNPESHLQ